MGKNQPKVGEGTDMIPWWQTLILAIIAIIPGTVGAIWQNYKTKEQRKRDLAEADKTKKEGEALLLEKSRQATIDLIAALETRIANLHCEVRDQGKQIDELKNEIDLKDKRIEELEREVAKKDDRIAELEKRVEELEKLENKK